ncbi:unnamed protein product [Somion occarium]|uniref:CUE domain-containing protein n=1 Tax=Somion occarium TaxID=3059160 RepID=A0ABP1CU79_9APHY
MAVLALPSYPTSRARQSLTPSQVASLNQLILSSLSQCRDLPVERIETSSAKTFISSYAKDVTSRVLQSLIWEDPKSKSETSNMSQIEKAIHYRVLLLAEKVSGSLDFQTLVDLGVAYGSSNPKRLRTLFSSAYSSNSKNLDAQVSSEVLPAFTSFLASSTQGLYGIRKLSHIILSCLRPAPAPLQLLFARDKSFILALAKAYDEGLSSFAQSYGGIRLPDSSDERPLEEWERIFLDTKVAFLDTFHVLLRALFDDVAAVPSAGRDLASRCEPAFEVIFALLDLPSFQGESTSSSTEPIPFLNQSLLADYQHAYDLSRTFVSVLRKADGERTQLLEHALRSLDNASDTTNPGALKFIVRSSGIPAGIDHKGKGPSRYTADAKGKGKAVITRPVAEDNPQLDAAVSQVLDILPDQPAPYIRYLLGHPDYPYKGNAERLIEAIFEGGAPSVEEVDAAMARETAEQVSEVVHPAEEEEYQYTKDRQNVFDEEQMDLSQVRFGKKTEDLGIVIQDRAVMDQMKADILRRAEEAMYSDEEEDVDPYADKDRKKGKDVAFEDELDEGGGVKVRDGEPTDDEESSNEGGSDEEEDGAKRPETILELAYIRDPKLFDRDGQTRRSKARADLKAQTGWSDEQIEGWRIMLERNPKKDSILRKHEFAGNQPGLPVPGTAGSSQHRGRGRGRGGARGAGRGRGRGGHHGEGASGGGRAEGGGARDRAWKDKHKASRGNHSRKAGHDKKMARAGGPPS